jgi:hypothetical protein
VTRDLASSAKALARNKKAINLLKQHLYHVRGRIAELEEQLVGMKMADASISARFQSACEARVREVADATARADLAESKRARAQALVDSIHASTTWHIMVRIVSVLDAFPLVRKLARTVLGLGRRRPHAAQSTGSPEC